MRHLLSVTDLDAAAATALLDTADRLRQALLGREVRKLPTLRGRTVITMFYENSTRTRVSFEVAGKWMSADTVNVSASGSSVAKGESLRDTALTLSAMGADCVIVRHPASGAAHRLAAWVDKDRETTGTPTVIVNAGDGTHEHPTQALLDAATLRDRLGGIAGKRVGIVGDVLHSRVARSNVFLLATLGAEVVLVAPPTLLPVGVAQWPCRVSPELDAELPALDAVMMLRVQAERMHGAFFPSSREYAVRLRPLRRPGRAPARARRGAAPRADGARHGDRPRRRGRAQRGGAAAGAHRRPRAHGRPLPPPRGSPGMSLVITGARPYGEGEPVDVLVRDGVVAEIGSGLSADETLDADGLVLLPGFVDLHTHLREPGGEESETIATGSAAAALGGFTAVFAMPNTAPVVDTDVVALHVRRRGAEVGLVDVHPVGAVTVGLRGERMAELGTMARSPAQVRMFSDDGRCVHDPLIMRRALEYATALDVVIAQHAEDHRLTGGAQAHEGEVASRLGLAGWPATAEETIVARDCALAREAGARLHVCHVSSAHTIAVLRAAKAAGVRVSAEVTPHHLLLTDARLSGYDPVNKVNPPLRTGADTEAMRAALAEGVIDVVATDHAPHAAQYKDTEWDAARPGMLGLQTALSIVAHTMVEPGLLDWRGVARVLSERPAEIGGLPDQGRPIAVGEPATFALVDPDGVWTVRGAQLASRAANTPFEGMRLPATVVATVWAGRVTQKDGKVVA